MIGDIGIGGLGDDEVINCDCVVLFGVVVVDVVAKGVVFVVVD